MNTPETPRALPIALARRMARTKPNDPRMAMLRRLYAWLPWSEQARCRAELLACRKAQRGELPAQVA